MDRAEFVKQEYIALREEIKLSKDRIFRIAGLGLVGLPSAYFFAEKYQLTVLKLTLPLLICTLVLLYLAESHAVMRCGRYIKQIIEPECSKPDACRGWEHWLEEKDIHGHDRRLVDKYMAVFFYLLFIIYYLASVALAWQAAAGLGPSNAQPVVLGVYVAVGILLLYFLYHGFRHAIQTD
jgi:hypothetical protein